MKLFDFEKNFWWLWFSNFFAVLMPGTLCVTLLLFKTISVCFCCCECLLVTALSIHFFSSPSRPFPPVLHIYRCFRAPLLEHIPMQRKFCRLTTRRAVLTILFLPHHFRFNATSWQILYWFFQSNLVDVLFIATYIILNTVQHVYVHTFTIFIC